MVGLILDYLLLIVIKYIFIILFASYGIKQDLLKVLIN